MATTFIPFMHVPHRKVVGRDVTGEPQFESAGEVGISPVRLDMSIGKTSIRTDKSGSQGRAEEELFDGRILVHPDHDIDFNDVLVIHGKEFQIVGIYPRYEMNHEIHHYQVDLMTWDSRSQD